MTQTINSIVMIATGDCSDYCTTPHRVLKPFTFREAHALFITAVPKNRYGGHGPDVFVGWLNEQGYIEDFPCHTMHVGSYNRMNIECDMADVLFEPEGDRK